MLGAVLVGTLVVFVAAQGCGGGSTSPTQTPAPTPDQLIERTAERMASLSSLRFQLTHEQGRTALITGVEAQKVDGAVVLPDQASLRVEAVASALAVFLEIQVAIDGAQAFMTDPLSGQWRDLPAESLPFNLLDLGATLGKIASSIAAPAFTTEKEIGGVVAQGIAGTVSGADLTPLIPSAVAEVQVELELWIDGDGLLRRVRIPGPVASKDPPDIVRILSFSAFDEPVTIIMPQ